MIRIQTIARLGQDATVNSVNGKTVINFSVAYSEKYKNSDGVEINNTIWLSCAYWSERINIANYLKKGVQVFLEGKPEVKLYTNKQGQTVPQQHIRVTNIQLLSSAQNNTNNQNNQNNNEQSLSNNTTEEEVTDLPF